MKSQKDIEEKLKELKRDRENLVGFIGAYSSPVTISGWTGHLLQLLDEYTTAAKIEIVEWILKDHPF